MRIAWIVGKRLITLVVTLFVTALIVFLSLHLVPGDTAALLLRGREATPGALAAVTKEFGLDRPLPVQFLDWLGGVLRLDLGTSFQFRIPVTTLILSRMPATIILVGYAMVLIVLIGVSLGVAASLRYGKRADRVILFVTQAFSAVPSFVASVILVSLVAVKLGWFPVYGFGTDPLDILRHMTLPAVSLAVVYIALLARVTRDAMVDQAQREHVDVARSRGIPPWIVVRRHIFRNALGPISTVSGLVVAGLIVGGAIVETIFGLSGIGSLLVTSVNSNDIPVVQGITLLIAATYVVVNTLVDIAQTVIDPRIAAGAAAR
ncbi:MAG: ABC transporter permease [Pseudolysinimonas sp.]